MDNTHSATVHNVIKPGWSEAASAFEVADQCGRSGEAALLDTLLQRCESKDGPALSHLRVCTESDDKTAGILRVIANHPSIRSVTLAEAVVAEESAAALHDLLTAPGSRIESLELDTIQVGENFMVMRTLTLGLKAASLRSLTINTRNLSLLDSQNMLTSACQNVNLVRLTLERPVNDETSISEYAMAILASQVRCLRIVSDKIGVHAAVVGMLALQYNGCSLASLELAGCDPKTFRAEETGGVMENFWFDLARLACLTNIVAISIRDLALPSNGATLERAAQWMRQPQVGEQDAPPNPSLLVLDHPGIDLGPDLTNQFRRLTHKNRIQFRFVSNRGFMEGAGGSFAHQTFGATEVGVRIAEHLVSGETGDLRALVSLALVNRTTHREAVTGRSDEFRNELFRLIDGRKTGAIHALRQMMLEARVGLTAQHLDQVRLRARERGVEHLLPALPQQ